MQLELPKETSNKLEEASKLLGVKRQQVIDRAILLYLDNVSKYLDLKKELLAWDVLSDESLINSEKSV